MLFELVVGGLSIMSSSVSLKKPLIVLCGVVVVSVPAVTHSGGDVVCDVVMVRLV
jgi:hypothetical protein